MKLEAYISAYKNNKLVKRQKANSLVKQFIQLLERHLASRVVDTKQTNGNMSSAGAASYTFQVAAGVGDTTLGVVVGTDSTAVSIADYALKALIPHGVNTGQLEYGAVSVTLNQTVNNKCYLTISRTFNNNSGGSITIREVGIYCLGINATYKHCIDRSLFELTINNGESYTIVYELAVSV